MNDNSILKSLTKLEDDLREINSAKEQVETMATAYDALRVEIQSFVTAVGSLSQNAHSLMNAISSHQTNDVKKFEESLKSLETACSSILDSFAAKCNDANLEFGNKVNSVLGTLRSESESTLASLREEISDLHEKVERLNIVNQQINSAVEVIRSLKDDTSRLSSELKSSQHSQDATLANIKTANDSIKGLVQSIDNSVSQMSSDLSDQLAAIKQESLPRLKTTLSQGIAENKKAIEELKSMQQDTNASVKLNRNFTLAVLFLLVCLLLKFVL